MPRSTSHLLAGLLLVLFALPALAGAPANAAPGKPAPEWNDDEIEWLSYEDGMSFIEITGKPGLLVFKTDWCPHCTNYSRVFHDPRVVELSKRFVMIRIDRDADQVVSMKYGKFGEYVPRTLFVKTNGQVDWYHHGQNTRYPYFLDERDPHELVALMESFPAPGAVAAPAE